MKVIIVCKSTPLRNLSLNGEILRRGMAQSPASVLGGTSKVNLEHLEIRTFLFFFNGYPLVNVYMENQHV